MKKYHIFIIAIFSLLSFDLFAQKTYINYRKTVDSLDRQLFLLEKTNNMDSTKANAYLALAKAHSNRDNNFAAIYAQKALSFSQEIEYQKGIAEALLYIGLLDKEHLEGLDKAIESLQKSLRIYHELGYKDKMVELHRVIGSFYYRMAFDNPDSEKSFQEALNHYQQALQVHIEIGDSLEMAEDYELIGELYSYLKNDEQALQSLRNAQKIRENLGEQDINNKRLLAKYERIEKLKEEVQHSNTTKIIVIFCIIIAVLVGSLLYSHSKRKEAYNKLKEHDIDINSLSEEKVNAETEIGHKAKIKL